MQGKKGVMKDTDLLGDESIKEGRKGEVEETETDP